MWSQPKRFDAYRKFKLEKNFKNMRKHIGNYIFDFLGKENHEHGYRLPESF